MNPVNDACHLDLKPGFRADARPVTRKAALIVPRITTDVDRNLATIERLARGAAASGAELVLLPEAVLTGLENNDDPVHDLLLGQTIPGQRGTHPQYRAPFKWGQRGTHPICVNLSIDVLGMTCYNIARGSSQER